MGLYTALHHLLCSDDDVAALVGPRIYQQRRPQFDGRSQLLIVEITAAGGHHQAGADGLVEARVQIEAWSTSVGEARQIRDAVRDCVDGYAGTVNAVEIVRVFVENRLLNVHISKGGGDEATYQGILDAVVWHRE